MFEYECLGCGKKYYSSTEFEGLNDKYCDICHDYVFYSTDELMKHKDDLKWLLEQYNDLKNHQSNDISNLLK